MSCEYAGVQHTHLAWCMLVAARPPPPCLHERRPPGWHIVPPACHVAFAPAARARARLSSRAATHRHTHAPDPLRVQFSCCLVFDMDSDVRVRGDTVGRAAAFPCRRISCILPSNTVPSSACPLRVGADAPSSA
ncbi:MAG: hypothetical protein EOO41_00265 [Methanobacteriota archaeon]|nr:MAG: hypothetical protein EOO41_00265 [Euryarchaeota archaeon]